MTTYVLVPLPSSTTSLATGPPSRLSSQLKLLLVAQTIIQLSRSIFAWLGHFFYELLSLYDLFEHLSLVGLTKHPPDVHFEEDHERLVKGEDKIKLTHRVEVPVEGLNKQMNLLQNNELIGPLAGNADDKVQAGVPPVHEFVFPLLDNVAHLGRPGEDVGGDVAEDSALVGFGVGREELSQADLALPGHEDDEIPPDGLAGGFEVVEIHLHFRCDNLCGAVRQ
mmetsp:Transcript_8062/g.13349  ORF Transcript_8062/g.13349 Transcript_8062/m.13349 type:complete len:223 (+) Transcript_8062:203-871(+)